MTNVKGLSNCIHSAWGDNHSFLPPKCPVPTVSTASADHQSNAFLGSGGVPGSRVWHRQHQRTSSGSFLFEEQPLWIDDLLNESETPVKRGAHRRSSSDSFASSDVPSITKTGMPVPEIFQNRSLAYSPSCGPQNFDQGKDRQYAFPCTCDKYCEVPNWGCETTWNAGSYPTNNQTMMGKIGYQSMKTSGIKGQAGAIKSLGTESLYQEELSSHGLNTTFEGKKNSLVKHCQPEAEKKVKQQFAQRSRVRKLQYIAELERNVQALQAEGSEISAELHFCDQQNLILSLENKALRQRLGSLAQEQLIKLFQQEMLEREIARLKGFCQQ